MKDASKQDVENYVQDELFWKESKKEHIKMRDGAELLCFYTKKGNDSSKPSVLFIPGYGTGVFSWSDLWDELYKDHDFYVFDSREKDTSKVKWKHKGDMNTLAYDIKEVIEHFNFDQNKLFIISASYGCSMQGRALAEGWINPAGTLFIGPSIKFILPRKILWLAYILPSFLMRFPGRQIVKAWIKIMVPLGFQRKAYLDLVGRASGMKWKKTLSTSRWDASEDYSKIKCPTWVTKDPNDKLHLVEFTETVKRLLSHATIVEVPDYLFMHHYPDVEKFGKMIKGYINEIFAKK